jgi:spore coat polysaccharide biosynthesis protein SpsF
MKVVAIVQARMGSSRLPGKVLMPVLHKPIIVHQLDRIVPSKMINELWLATSEDTSDDPLAAAVERAGYRVFRGSQDDVLERFFHLATRAKADVVVRLTGDCPFHSYEVIDYVVGAFLDAMPKYTYASNVFPPTLPDGLDVEVFSYSVLKKAALECKEPLEREHVTPGIHGQFREPKMEILNITAPADFSHLRWTLDYQEDFDVVKAVYEALYPTNPMFTWMDVLALMTKDPSLVTHNQRQQRNETFVEQLPTYLAKGQ